VACVPAHSSVPLCISESNYTQNAKLGISHTRMKIDREDRPKSHHTHHSHDNGAAFGGTLRGAATSSSDNKRQQMARKGRKSVVVDKAELAQFMAITEKEETYSRLPSKAPDPCVDDAVVDNAVWSKYDSNGSCGQLCTNLQHSHRSVRTQDCLKMEEGDDDTEERPEVRAEQLPYLGQESRIRQGGNENGSYFAMITSEEPSMRVLPREHMTPRTAMLGQAKLAAGRAILFAEKFEQLGTCEVETGSVYGASLVLPQIARSTAWSGTFTALALRSYTLLLINIALQGFLLSMIGEEQILLYPFAGQMHLCDFGASIPRCEDMPDLPNCRGPHGTSLSYARLYSYDVWSTRNFVKDSLKSMFPHKASDIETQIDPGEYGLENYWCRAVCVFIFMMAVVEDFKSTMMVLFLLYRVPTSSESWIEYEQPGEDEDIDGLDLVKFKVAGMPFGWKVANVFLIFFPKFLLWLALAISGVHFLMETASITDMVINAMALTFVLDIDELMFARLATPFTKEVMQRIESMELWAESDEDEAMTDAQVLDHFERSELGRARWGKMAQIFPTRLVQILVAQGVFVILYYTRNCVYYNGGWVSKAMSAPKDLTFNPVNLMFGFEPDMEKDNFWQMPE